MAERRPPKVAPPRARPHTSTAKPPVRRPGASKELETLKKRRPEPTPTQEKERPARPLVASTPWQRVSPSTAPVETVTQRMNQRLAERKRTERRRSFARFGKWAAVAGAVAIALWAFFMAPFFALDPAKVEMSGITSEIDADAVAAVMASHEGESIALLNVGHVSNQLKDLPGVLDANVERVWPSGLRVTLVPRHPVAAIAQGEGFILLDADAIEVGTADVAPADLPLIDVPVGDERVLAAVLEVIRNLPADLLTRVSGVGAQTEDTVTFVLRDGPRVEWGSAEDSALKAQVLEAMLASPSAASASVIDVSAPTLPITRVDA